MAYLRRERMTKADRCLQRRSSGLMALCAVAGLCTGTLGCNLPWSVSPKEPSRVSNLSGWKDSFRVCVRRADRPIRSLQLEARGQHLNGNLDDPDSPQEACSFFQGPLAEKAIDGESTLIAETGESSAPERIPLTSKSIEFRPQTRFESSTRIGYLQPLEDDYAGLLQLHSTIYYRLSPLRVGAIVDGRVGQSTALVGTGVSLNGNLPMSERWLLGLDASYGLGVAAYGSGRWDGQWYHGPRATLSVGRTPAGFLGAPPTFDRAAIGPFISVEYLRLPRQDRALFVLGAGFMLRYGP